MVLSGGRNSNPYLTAKSLLIEELRDSVCSYFDGLWLVIEVNMAELIKRQDFMLIGQLLNELS